MIPRQWLWDRNLCEPIQVVKLTKDEDGTYNFHYRRPHKRDTVVIPFLDIRKEIYTRFTEMYDFNRNVFINKD